MSCDCDYSFGPVSQGYTHYKRKICIFQF